MSTNTKTYKAEAAIELSAPLWLGSEFLGLLKAARIGGVDLHVVLPGFERKAGGETVLPSRAQFDWIGFFREREQDDDRDWPFGGVAKWQKGEVVEFSAHRLLAMPRHRVTPAEARKLKLDVDGWVSLLETWIDVIARVDQRKRTIKVVHQGNSAVVWLDRGKKTGELMRGKQRIMFEFGSTLAITPCQWGKVLKKASDGTLPPEAHLFLRDARHARNTGHHRRSVLDSATAAELSLARLRDNYLVSSDSRLASYVGKKARQIDGLSRFLKEVGRRLPGGIKDDLNEPRNKAIHAGHELDEETADAALRKAEEVVDLAFPWKKLL
ncbi:MAG TPA: hypothetical protein VFX35_08760 [Solirubrobacterales bacterium]|nr:hypothetical protein [Solirubrobacterales bacterium]